MSDLNFLVIGATGVVGSALGLELQRLGIEFVKTSSRKNTPKNHEYLNVLETRSIENLLSRHHFSHAINASGSKSDQLSEGIELNCLGSLNLMSVVQETSPKTKLTLLGSAAEYGDTGDSPAGESHPLKPMTAYGVSKKIQTEIFQFFTQKHNANFVLARLFNLSGNEILDQSVIGQLNRQTAEYLDGSRTELNFGLPDAERDFLDTSEAANGILRVSLHGLAGSVYNVASGTPQSIKDVVLESISAKSIPQEAVRFSSNSDSKTSLAVARSFAEVEKLSQLPKLKN